MIGNVASKNAPSPGIVVPHYIFGALSFLVMSIVLVFNLEDLTGHYFNPKILAVVHLIVLGWISMIIFGALYQLVPVVMDVRLFSENLARVTFYLFSISLLIFVYSFWFVSEYTYIFKIATFVCMSSIVLFVSNILLSSIKTKQSDYSVKFIITSVLWLLITVILGFVLAINLKSPFISYNHLQLLKVHAHFGIIGWFLLLIIGVGSKLIPMFLISHNLDNNKMRISYIMVNYGLLLLFVVFLFDMSSVFVLLASLLIVTGLISFILYLYEAYKKRIKRILDIGMKHTFLSFIVLIIPIILVLIVPFSFDEKFSMQSVLAYGISILIGFITSLILGQTYKTLPFIVWLYQYRGKMGKPNIPLPKELYSEIIATIHYYTYTAAFILMFAGVLLDIYVIKFAGSILLFIAALLYNFNVLKIISHKAKI